MIAELVTVLIAIVAVKLALWAAYWLGVLTTVMVATAPFWIRRGLFWLRRWRWRADRRAQPQRDEAQVLLALLCEQLHDRLQRDGTPPRTVISLTAGQWHEVTKR